jgi:hypothetical protein
VKPALFITFTMIFFAACKKHDPQSPIIQPAADSIVIENYILTDTTFHGQYPAYPYDENYTGNIYRTISLNHNITKGYLVLNTDTLRKNGSSTQTNVFYGVAINLYGKSYTTVDVETGDSIDIYCFRHISAAASQVVTYRGYKIP